MPPEEPQFKTTVLFSSGMKFCVVFSVCFPVLALCISLSILYVLNPPSAFNISLCSTVSNCKINEKVHPSGKAFIVNKYFKIGS